MPTLLSDFEVIRKDLVKIGENAAPFKVKFSTGGVDASKPALLMFAVSGLTIAHPITSAEVKINGHSIGRISPFHLGSSEEYTNKTMTWYTQHLVIPEAAKLKGKVVNENVLEISPAKLGDFFPPTPDPGGVDDFELKDIVCFFRQYS